MSGSISLSAMQMRQIDRYFRASMLNTFATWGNSGIVPYEGTGNQLSKSA
jgi:hypothetical protein